MLNSITIITSHLLNGPKDCKVSLPQYKVSKLIHNSGNPVFTVKSSFGIVDWDELSDHSDRICRYDPDSPSQMSKVLLGTVYMYHPLKVDSRARKPISQTRPNHDFELKKPALSQNQGELS